MRKNLILDYKIIETYYAHMLVLIRDVRKSLHDLPLGGIIWLKKDMFTPSIKLMD